MRLPLLALVCCASLAQAGITPTQCIRNSEAEVQWYDALGSNDVSDLKQRPYPQFPLGPLDLSAVASAYIPPAFSSSDTSSVVFSGQTLMQCGLDAFVQAGPYPAGTSALLFAQSAAMIEFTLTEPIDIVIHSRLTAVEYNNTNLQQAAVDFIHDGQLVAVFEAESGESNQTLTMSLTPGDWTISAACMSMLVTGQVGTTDDQTSETSIDLNIQTVPAPASIALLGLMMIAGIRRRR
jgi:hypothetical protein